MQNIKAAETHTKRDDVYSPSQPNDNIATKTNI